MAQGLERRGAVGSEGACWMLASRGAAGVVSAIGSPGLL